MNEPDRIDVILDTLEAQICAVGDELAALKQEAASNPD